MIEFNFQSHLTLESEIRRSFISLRLFIYANFTLKIHYQNNSQYIDYKYKKLNFS